MDFSDSVIDVCFRCKKYQPNSSEYLCSQCKVRQDFEKKISADDIVQEILKLPNGRTKGDLMEEYIDEMYEYYKSKEGVYHNILKKETTYKILENMCKGKNSGEVRAILYGLRDIPPYVLPAKFADDY